METEPNVSAFLRQLAAWLEQQHDPRLIVSPDGSQKKITDVIGASVDFCRYMGRVTKQAENS